jgi:hypothetical protein
MKKGKLATNRRSKTRRTTGKMPAATSKICGKKDMTCKPQGKPAQAPGGVKR